MKRQYILITAILGLLSGCYMGMTGRVIDAETQQPIEGAVVLVEWTKTHGLGEHWTESYKAAEAISDNNGKFHLPGCYSPFVGSPRVVAYKKGYVAWDNEYIFPTYEKRKDFVWGTGYQFELQPFKEDVYSHGKHVLFMYNPIADSNKISHYYNATRWEIMLMQKEIGK